jgi:hypothetical protein
MQSLSADKILAIWETGREQHELDRALTLLAACSPELSRKELAELTIGERDARLLRMRTLVLGPRTAGFAECPKCSASVEVAIDTAAFAQPQSQRAEPLEVQAGDSCVRFRLPTSRDLAEVVQAPDAVDGLRRLCQRSILEVRGNGVTDLDELSPEIVEALSHAMLDADPQAEITLALNCPDCGHGWQILFDIAAFFWDEIAAQARQLLHEIDAIARAYGWSEQEILSLPARRRRSYLELIGA